MNDFEGYKNIQVPIGGKTYTLYVADDHEKRTKGLSGVHYLPQRMGMFFKHDTMGNRAYTMEETLIPLRMIFIDENYNVVHQEDARPRQKEEVRPQSDFMYVIEILAR
jgi:uncharacterized membrane protein (UPF0127 family)